MHLASRWIWLIAVAAAPLACDSTPPRERAHAKGATSTQSAPVARPRVVAEIESERLNISGGPFPLSADLLVPTGGGPFPAVIYNHGSEREPSLRWLGGTARWLRARGFVALFPYRRGRPGSGGEFWKVGVYALPPAQQPAAMVSAFESELEDVQAAVRWLAKRPEVDPHRIAVAGCSIGGLLSLLAAERGEGIRAAIDFAGGSILWDRNPELRARMKTAAQGARVPVFLLQAANDYNTAPTRELDGVLSAAGKPHLAKVFPPFGGSESAGHAGFCNKAQEVWGPAVEQFLKRELDTKETNQPCSKARERPVASGTGSPLRRGSGGPACSASRTTLSFPGSITRSFSPR